MTADHSFLVNVTDIFMGMISIQSLKNPFKTHAKISVIHMPIFGVPSIGVILVVLLKVGLIHMHKKLDRDMPGFYLFIFVFA